jgi:ribosomal protein S18 acetylase RimI-like enzyme
MGTIVFRRLCADEFDDAHGILVSAAEWLVGMGIRQWTTAYPREVYLTYQQQGCNYGLEVDGELAVVVTLSRQSPPEWADRFGPNPIWWLSKLATAPDFRGRGLGILAVRHAIHQLSDQHADGLYLDCVQGNGFLIDFYERLGFQVVDRRPVPYSTGLFDMVLMELPFRCGSAPGR